MGKPAQGIQSTLPTDPGPKKADQMTFKRYFSKDFPKDLFALQLSHVPQVLKDIFNDDDLCVFGGKDWANVAKDLEAKLREKFVPGLVIGDENAEPVEA